METGSQHRIYSVANHALSPKRVTDPKNGKDWLIDWLKSPYRWVSTGDKFLSGTPPSKFGRVPPLGQHSKLDKLFVFPCHRHQMGFSLECPGLLARLNALTVSTQRGHLLCGPYWGYAARKGPFLSPISVAKGLFWLDFQSEGSFFPSKWHDLGQIWLISVVNLVTFPIIMGLILTHWP